VAVRRALAFVTFVLVTPACGIFFSVDGYEGSASSDATAEPSDSPGVDVVDGAATGDTQAPPDAPRDGAAGDAGDAGDGATWCATQTHEAGVWYRCFDYDEPDSAPIEPNTAGKATIVVERDDAATSPPNALVVTIPQLMPYPASAYATDMLASGGGSQAATLAFDLRTDATDGVFLAAMQWGHSSSGHAVYYMLSIGGAGDLSVLEQGSGDGGGLYRYPADAAPVDSNPHRYELTVSMSTGVATLSVDGNPVLDAGGQYGGVWQLTFTWGVSYIEGQTFQPDVYHFDNVVLEGR
jgi:hypothetical protein